MARFISTSCITKQIVTGVIGQWCRQDKTRQDNVVIGRRRMASMPLNINLTKNNCKQI